MKNVYEICKKCKNYDEKYVSINTVSYETHGCGKDCFSPVFKLFEQEIDKFCNNCGFSVNNNPEGMSCYNYREKLGVFDDYCRCKSRWRSIEDVEKLAEEKKEAKLCINCGFSSHNNPEGMSCYDYKKKLGIDSCLCLRYEYWKSIDEVKKIVDKYNDMMDEQIELENKILQTQIDAQKEFLAKWSTPFIHWDLDKEVNQKTKQYAWSDCENCIYFSGFGNFCKNGGYCGEKNDVTECKKYKPKKIKEGKKEMSVIEKVTINKKKEVKEMEKPKSLEEVEKRIEERINKREELIKKIHTYRDNKNIFEKHTCFPSEVKYWQLTKKFRKYLGLNKRDVWILRDYNYWCDEVKHMKKILYLNGKIWKKLAEKLNGFEEKAKSFENIANEFLMKEKMKLLCKIAPCYEDKKKTKRTKVLLQTCEFCGVDTPVEGNFCKECGKPVKF
jgi:hypothetical protein